MHRNVLCLSCHPHARDAFWLPHTCIHVCGIEEVVLSVVTLVLRPPIKTGHHCMSVPLITHYMHVVDFFCFAFLPHY